MSRGPRPDGAKPRTSVGPSWNSSAIASLLLAAEAGDVAALQVHDADDVLEDRMVVAQVAGVADELRIAAQAGDVLAEFDEQARRSGPCGCRACCSRG